MGRKSMRDLWDRVIAVSVCIFVILACSTPLHAQTIGSLGTITGRILDQTGIAVPGATVSIKNDLSGAVTTASSDAMGRFSVPALQVGTYTVEVALPGFQTARSSGLLLTASGLENVDVTLKVAAVNQEVTVSEFVPL